MKHTLSILLMLLSLTSYSQVVLVGTSGGGASPNVTAGDSLTTSAETVSLKGTITGSPTNYYWVHNGLGTIADSTKLNTTYTVHANDTVIWFDLVAFYNFSGVLDTAYDRRVVNVVSVRAGSDQTICADQTIQLDGFYSGDSAVWSGEGVTFDDVHSMTAVATPTDTSDHSYTITLTSYYGTDSLTDNMVTTLTPLPKVYAGADDTITSGTTYTISDAYAYQEDSVNWSIISGTGTLNDSTTVNPIYTFGEDDASVSLSLTAYSDCDTIADTINLTINFPKIYQINMAPAATRAAAGWNKFTGANVNDLITLIDTEGDTGIITLKNTSAVGLSSGTTGYQTGPYPPQVDSTWAASTYTPVVSLTFEHVDVLKTFELEFYASYASATPDYQNDFVVGTDTVHVVINANAMAYTIYNITPEADSTIEFRITYTVDNNTFLNGMILRESTAYAASIDSIYERLKAEYVVASYSGSTGTWITNQNADGSWDDIDYETDLPYNHLIRLEDLSTVYMLEGGYFEGDESLRDSIIAGLNYWFAGDYVSSNWWTEEIFQQRYLMPIGILMKDTLTAYSFHSLDSIASYLQHPKICAIDEGYEAACSGVDMGEKAVQMVHKGILLNNVDSLMVGIDTLKATNEFQTIGLQEDYSYQYHGPMLYSNGYGKVQFQNMANFTYYTRGTEFTMQDANFSNFRTFTLDHLRWSNYNGRCDWSTMGREISRTYSGKSSDYTTYLTKLQTADATYSDDYDVFKKIITSDTTVTGNKHFPQSDYQIHRGDNYFLSIKMCSERTRGTEVGMSGENKKGYYLPFGATNIMRNGTEYTDIAPLWDWFLIPGVTAPNTLGKTFTTEFIYYIWGTTRFVGGVTNDTIGIAAMDLDWAGVTGKKSWFNFEDFTICLGAGITDADDTVNTSINQCLQDGSTYVHLNGAVDDDTIYAPGWIWHDSIGYIVPANDVIIENESRTVNWNTIGTESSSKTGNVFSLYINHGDNPTDSTYEYVIYPATDTATLNTFIASYPYTVLINSDTLQALEYSDYVGIVFYKPTSIELSNGITVTASDSCIVLMEDQSTSYKVYASIPMNRASNLLITLTEGASDESATIVLSDGALAGKSDYETIANPDE